MELLNPAFLILCVKIAICVLPAVLGVYLISVSEEKKRDLRSKICNYLFGVRNAIPFPQFDRATNIIGALALIFAAVASWFLIFADLLSGR